MKKPKTCGFISYRVSSSTNSSYENQIFSGPLKTLLSNEVESAIKEGYSHFICSFSLGFDTCFVEAVIVLRERYPKIALEAALAYENQADHWSEKDRDKHFRLLAKCDRETFISRNYARNCYLNRNRYIVEQSQRLIAVCDGRFGGAMHAVNWAKARNAEVIVINPATYKVIRENILK